MIAAPSLDSILLEKKLVESLSGVQMEIIGKLNSRI